MTRAITHRAPITPLSKASLGEEAIHEVPNLLSIQPQEVFDIASTRGQSMIANWDRDDASALLAGMAIEPRFEANVLRIDLLYRIVLANSVGNRTPDDIELMHVLNDEFKSARILNLEDPPESPRVETVPTSRGNFRIISGHIENAAVRTQTLLRAFESMIRTPSRSNCIESVYSLLAMSERVISQSISSDSQQQQPFPPNSRIIVQQNSDTASYESTVFSSAELNELNIDRNCLTPFLMTTDQQKHVSYQRVMNSFVEAKPIFQRNDGSYILMPIYVATAIATLLIECEVNNQTQAGFLSRLLYEQEWYTYPSRFWDLSACDWTSISDSHLRYTTKQIETDRYIQVIQCVLPLDDFQSNRFSTQELPCGVVRQLEQLITAFLKFLSTTGASREGITILLISDWGAILKLNQSMKHMAAPPNWRCIPLHFAEIEALGVDQYGTLDDLCRIIRQVEIFSKNGLHFSNRSGILNLYEHWRRTHGRLTISTDDALNCDRSNVPNIIDIGTDLVRDVRDRTLAKRNRRALPFIDGSHKIVQEVDMDDSACLKPIYVADDDYRRGTLRGAVSLSERTWWVHVISNADQHTDLSHNILRSVLLFLAESGEYATKSYPNVFQEPVSLVQIQLRGTVRLDQGDHCLTMSVATPQQGPPIQLRLSSKGIRVVCLDDAWFMSISHTENTAELELAAATLEALGGDKSPDDARQRFKETIKEQIRSPDWRWLHTESVSIPIDKLRISGLIKSFHPIRLSAFMVVTCGLFWDTMPPSLGSTIVGEAECIMMLTQYLGIIHRKIGNLAGRLDREAAIIFCGDHYQRARQELRQWQTTSRALLAIVGADIGDIMLKKHGEVTTVKAATRILCEIFTHATASSGGRSVRWSDVEEILALVVVARHSEQLLASIQKKLIPAEVRITPWGELVADEDITNSVLRKSAQRSTNRALEKAANTYLEEHGGEATSNAAGELTSDPEFERVLSAEYGISSEVMWQLAEVLTDLAILRKDPVFVVKKSELSREMCTRIGCPSAVINRFIDRLTLPQRLSEGSGQSLGQSALELGRLDRPLSMINRPIPSLNDAADPRLVVIPICILDSLDYMLYGLHSGSLQGACWVSVDAKKYVGRAGDRRGRQFEGLVGEKIQKLGYEVHLRKEISGLLNLKIDNQLGDVDVLVVNREADRVWVIEAKDLKAVRTITEAALRMHDYRGRMKARGLGEVPDSLFRHLRRVRFLRDNRSSIKARLRLTRTPEVRGLLVVSRDQPMSLLHDFSLADGRAVVVDDLDEFDF